MENLHKLLERFKRSLDKDLVARAAVMEAVKKVTGAALKEENISIKDGVLGISAGATLKNELKIKEKAVLEELKNTHHVRIGRILYK